MRFGIRNVFYLFFSNKQRAAVLDYTYELDVPVCPDRLLEALKMSLRAFPFFRLRPCLDREGHIVARENTAEPHVWPMSQEALVLGTDETDGYLFCVRYDEHRVRLTASHGLADARGVARFMNTLCWYLLTLSGAEMEPEGLIDLAENGDDPQLSRYFEDVIADYTGELPEPPNFALGAPAFVTEPAALLDTPDTLMLHITWDHRQLMARIHELGTTPAALAACAAAEAFYRRYGDQGKPVVVEIPVDLRGTLGVQAQSNFTANMRVAFPIELRALPLEEKLDYMNKKIRSHLGLPMLANEQTLAPFLGMINSLTVQSGEAIDRLTNELIRKPPEHTFILSNVGLLKFPTRMAPHVKDARIELPQSGVDPMLMMMSFGQVGRLMVFQNQTDAGLAEELARVLAEMGVEVTFSNEGLHRYDYVRPERFERLNEAAD